MKKFLNKYNLDYKFGLILLIISIIFSIMMPIYQTPDEPAHLQMIYDELNQDINTYEVYANPFKTYEIIWNTKEKIDKKAYFYFDDRLEEKLSFKLPKITIIRHIPQIIAVLISHLFNLNTFFALFLMELFACINYSIICMISLKLMPIKKDMMKFIMLLPICIQQISSLSYDSMLLPMLFLFIAYIFNLKFNKNTINIKDILIGLILLLIIGIIKIPYILFGLLFLLLIDKININIGKFSFNIDFIKKNKYTILTIITILIPMSLLVLTKNDFTRGVVAFILSPLEFIKIEYLTFKTFLPHLVYSATGSFAWLNVNASITYCFILIIMLFISYFNVQNEFKLSRLSKFILILFILVITSLITLSLYAWSIGVAYNICDFNEFNLSEMVRFIKEHSDLVVLGLQGRYYIPLLPLIGLLFNSKRINDILIKIKFKYINILFWVCSYIYIFSLLLNRFWI